MTDKTEAQPEALRLAQFFESLAKSSHRWWDGVPAHEKAATVLRALVTEIEQLKAQLSARQAVSNPWQQAIDHELVCLHLGVAGVATKESALKALQELIQCHVEIAINPQTNGGLSLQPHTEAQAVPDGWRLVPVEPDSNMKRAAQKALMDHSPHSEWLEEEWPDGLRMWSGMLSAAPPPPERETGRCPECGDTHCPRAQNPSWPCVPNPLRKRSH